MTQPPPITAVVGAEQPTVAVLPGPQQQVVVLPRQQGPVAVVGGPSALRATLARTGSPSVTVGASQGIDTDAVHWRGPWTPGTQYNRNDLVTYQDKLWICDTPTNTIGFSTGYFTEIGAIHTVTGTLQAADPSDPADLVTLRYLQTSVPETVPISYRHVQSTPAAVWTITHNLGFQPNATVVDSAGTEVIGDLDYVDDHTVRITFSAAFGGECYLS